MTAKFIAPFSKSVSDKTIDKKIVIKLQLDVERLKKYPVIKQRPQQIADLHKKIQDCIEHGKYAHTKHALQRQSLRNIELDDVLYVLKTGYHEKIKTTFDDIFQDWKCAIRGITLEGDDIRIIIAFDQFGMLIITVMHVLKEKYERT